MNYTAHLLTRQFREQARHLLPRLMSEISEDCYCAGWMAGLEHTLWDFVRQGEAVDWGMGRITIEQLDTLRLLAAGAGGWFVYEEGRAFVPMADWLQRHAEQVVRNKAMREQREQLEADCLIENGSHDYAPPIIPGHWQMCSRCTAMRPSASPPSQLARLVTGPKANSWSLFWALEDRDEENDPVVVRLGPDDFAALFRRHCREIPDDAAFTSFDRLRAFSLRIEGVDYIALLDSRF